MTAVKEPEITRKTVKKPSGTKRTVKEASSLVSPSMLQSSVHAVTASLISPSVPRLSVEDVLEVFASVRNTRPPLPHLPFQVVPSGPHNVSITPPPYAFDGKTANVFCRSVCFERHILCDLTHWFALLSPCRWPLCSDETANEEDPVASSRLCAKSQSIYTPLSMENPRAKVLSAITKVLSVITCSDAVLCTRSGTPTRRSLDNGMLACHNHMIQDEFISRVLLKSIV